MKCRCGRQKVTKQILRLVDVGVPTRIAFYDWLYVQVCPRGCSCN